MADFTTLELQGNANSTATVNWLTLAGANHELRFSDVSTVALTTTSASWPYITRPVATAGVDYAYLFSTDIVGAGIYGASATASASVVGNAPAAFAVTQYLSFRWSWDSVGTFASAPIMTAYPSTAHGAISRGDASILGGQTTDTGATQRSYLKGQMYGIGTTVQVPAANTPAPVVTDGTTGSVSPATGAWLAAWQSLQGDNDYITYGSIPTAVTAQVLSVGLRMFIGPNLLPSTYVPVVSMKYTYT